MRTETGQAGAGAIPEKKICDMAGVREYEEGYTVELWRNAQGRLTIRAFNDGNEQCTDVDLFDVIQWSKAGPNGSGLDAFNQE